jgi:hypothetical protein
MDGFTDSSASRLQSLAKHASDATAYKRDLDIAISQLAALKLLVHGKYPPPALTLCVQESSLRYEKGV